MKNTIRIYLILCFCLLSFSLLAQYQDVKLVKTKVTESITASLPTDFALMSDEMYARKYGAYRPPIAIYTDPDANVDFGVNQMADRSLRAFASSNWSPEDMEMIKGIYKASIAGIHTEVDFVQDKIEEINGRSFIVLEFIGTVKDEEKTFALNNRPVKQYSYLMYTVQEGDILLFNFNCPALLQPRWQATANEIMHSIKIK